MGCGPSTATPDATGPKVKEDGQSNHTTTPDTVPTTLPEPSSATQKESTADPIFNNDDKLLEDVECVDQVSGPIENTDTQINNQSATGVDSDVTSSLLPDETTPQTMGIDANSGVESLEYRSEVVEDDKQQQHECEDGQGEGETIDLHDEGHTDLDSQRPEEVPDTVHEEDILVGETNQSDLQIQQCLNGEELLTTTEAGQICVPPTSVSCEGQEESPGSEEGLQEITAAQSEPITVPIETTPSTNEETVPNNEETVVTNEETVVINEETVVTNEETVPTNEETVPTNEETVPTNEETVPTNEETVVTNEETVVTNEETVVTNVVTNEETAVTNDETVATNEETVATNEETVVTNEETVATNEETVVTNKEAAVTNEETVVTNKEAAVTNEETVVNNETVATNEETVVTNDETAVTNEETVATNEETVVTNEETVATNEVTLTD